MPAPKSGELDEVAPVPPDPDPPDPVPPVPFEFEPPLPWLWWLWPVLRAWSNGSEYSLPAGLFGLGFAYSGAPIAADGSAAPAIDSATASVPAAATGAARPRLRVPIGGAI